MQLQTIYTDAEIKELLASLTVAVDSREQNNGHILRHLEQKQVPTVTRKLSAGDYGAMLPASPAMGIPKDVLLPVVIERKNSVDELAGSIKERTRFENELIRADPLYFTLMVEDEQGFSKMLNGEYRSQYNAKALIGSLQSFESRYRFSTAYIQKDHAGAFIYSKLLYFARNALKGAL